MRDDLRAFLAPFPARVVVAAEQAAEHGASVVPSDPALAEFRRAPEACLHAVSARADDLWRTMPVPGRVVWCLTGTTSAGLDAFELPAVFGRRLHLDLVHQVAAGDEKRLVAVGTLRDEYLAVSFAVPDAASDAHLADLLSKLAAQPAPAAVVFLSADRARRVDPQSPVIGALRRFQAAGGSLGLRVPRGAAASAYADPVAQLAPFRPLVGDRIGLVRIVRFDASPFIDAEAHHRFMRLAGLQCDSSMPVDNAVDDGAAPAGALAREGAYAGASPYRPQPFDMRVPWFHCDPDMWLELPAAPVTAATVDAWWASRLGPSDQSLAPLLDMARMEAFFRASRINPAEERRYPDVRVYNWPAPAPPSRVALLDGGEAAPDQAGALMAELGRLVREAGPRAHIADHDGLLERARTEVEARYAISAAGAIEVQHEAHGYLIQVPHESPLRPDYADFARFVPATLGDALELGSGYGVLAWALAPRARRYTCLDLDRQMFGTLRPDLHQSGVVADMHRLPFVDGSFDSVVANNVLEHLYNPLAGLTEIRRVLRPGGHLLALVPFDALNNRHELPAHHWKLDEPGLRQALAAVGFGIDRLEIVNLYDLGVAGAFPTCYGLEAEFDAVNAGGQASAAPTTRRMSPGPSQPPSPSEWLPGRLLPMVREIVGFERWAGRRVLAVSSEPSDVDEFAHFGAHITLVAPDAGAWPVADASADLVYAFLTLPRGPLSSVAAEIRRVLAPGGVVVAGFRNRDGLRYLARVQSYFADACDLRELVDADALVQLADDDGARFDDEYVSRNQVDDAFAAFGTRRVAVRNLTPDDVPGVDPAGYEPGFWHWLAATCGRFVLLRAVK